VILLGRLAGTGEIEKLGPVQTDAVTAAGQALLGLAWKLDVPRHLDTDAVGRLGGKVAEAVEAGGHGPGRLHLEPVAGNRLLVRLEDHHPLIAVEDHRFPPRHVGEERPEADDCGDLEPFGDDRGVAAGSAEFGGESLHEPAVEVGRLAGGEVVGEDDHRLRDRREGLAPLAEEIA
jgi:hypothetical protein